MTETLPERQAWKTPQLLWEGLHEEFGFTKDVAAKEEDAKTSNFIGKDDDALRVGWGHGEICWCNPPYRNVRPWLKKATLELANRNDTVFIVKAAVGSRWFHELVMLQAEWWFFSGRVYFEPPPGVTASSPAFDAMLVRYSLGAKPGFMGSRCPKTGKILVDTQSRD